MRAQKYQRGIIDPLSLVGLGFLVLSLVAITVTASNPLKKQFFGAFARYSPDALIRQRERTGNCKGAYCLAPEIIDNKDNPNNQTGAAAEILETINNAVQGDPEALKTLEENNAAIFREIEKQLPQEPPTEASSQTPAESPPQINVSEPGSSTTVSSCDSLNCPAGTTETQVSGATGRCYCAQQVSRPTTVTNSTTQSYLAPSQTETTGYYLTQVNNSCPTGSPTIYNGTAACFVGFQQSSTPQAPIVTDGGEVKASIGDACTFSSDCASESCNFYINKCQEKEEGLFSGLEGLGTYGLGGGNSILVPPPPSALNPDNPEGFVEYAVGSAYSMAAGGLLGGAIIGAAGAPALLTACIANALCLRALVTLNLIDDAATSISCARGNQDACSYVVVTATNPVPGMSLADSVNDFISVFRPSNVSREIMGFVDDFSSLERLTDNPADYGLRFADDDISPSLNNETSIIDNLIPQSSTELNITAPASEADLLAPSQSYIDNLDDIPIATSQTDEAIDIASLSVPEDLVSPARSRSRFNTILNSPQTDLPPLPENYFDDLEIFTTSQAEEALARIEPINNSTNLSLFSDSASDGLDNLLINSGEAERLLARLSTVESPAVPITTAALTPVDLINPLPKINTPFDSPLSRAEQAAEITRDLFRRVAGQGEVATGIGVRTSPQRSNAIATAWEQVVVQRVERLRNDSVSQINNFYEHYINDGSGFLPWLRTRSLPKVPNVASDSPFYVPEARAKKVLSFFEENYNVLRNDPRFREPTGNNAYVVTFDFEGKSYAVKIPQNPSRRSGYFETIMNGEELILQHGAAKYLAPTTTITGRDGELYGIQQFVEGPTYFLGTTPREAEAIRILKEYDIGIGDPRKNIVLTKSGPVIIDAEDIFSVTSLKNSVVEYPEIAESPALKMWLEDLTPPTSRSNSITTLDFINIVRSGSVRGVPVRYISGAAALIPAAFVSDYISEKVFGYDLIKLDLRSAFLNLVDPNFITENECVTIAQAEGKRPVYITSEDKCNLLPLNNSSGEINLSVSPEINIPYSGYISVENTPQEYQTVSYLTEIFNSTLEEMGMPQTQDEKTAFIDRIIAKLIESGDPNFINLANSQAFLDYLNGRVVNSQLFGFHQENINKDQLLQCNLWAIGIAEMFPELHIVADQYPFQNGGAFRLSENYNSTTNDSQCFGATMRQAITDTRYVSRCAGKELRYQVEGDVTAFRFTDYGNINRGDSFTYGDHFGVILDKYLIDGKYWFLVTEANSPKGNLDGTPQTYLVSQDDFDTRVNPLSETYFLRLNKYNEGTIPASSSTREIIDTINNASFTPTAISPAATVETISYNGNSLAESAQSASNLCQIGSNGLYNNCPFYLGETPCTELVRQIAEDNNIAHASDLSLYSPNMINQFEETNAFIEPPSPDETDEFVIQPGWVVFFATDPETSNTVEHVGIVASGDIPLSDTLIINTYQTNSYDTYSPRSFEYDETLNQWVSVNPDDPTQIDRIILGFGDLEAYNDYYSEGQ